MYMYKTVGLLVICIEMLGVVLGQATEASEPVAPESGEKAKDPAASKPAAAPAPPAAEGATPGTISDTSYTVQTDLPVIEKVTDIPQSDVDDALFLEVGDYSTVSFQYYNDRFLGWHLTKPPGYICHDDYVRCLFSQTLRHPVCAVHKYNYREVGVRNLATVCDMHHYNCRRGFRYWFVMKDGICSYNDNTGYTWFYHPLVRK